LAYESHVILNVLNAVRIEGGKHSIPGREAETAVDGPVVLLGQSDYGLGW